jgi:hypothetical protein
VDYEEIFWMRLGYSKHCIEVGDILHGAIKAKEPLSTQAYKASFCGITPTICKVDMTQGIGKRKVRREGREVVHNTLWNHCEFIKEFKDQFLWSDKQVQPS